MSTIAKSMQRGLLVLIAVLQIAPLWADDVGDAARQNVIATPREDASWMSGGIGDEARDEMRKAAASYGVQVVFSDRQGSYLADIPFAVSRLDGRPVLSGVSEGPLLYLKLPPGSYQISVQLDGASQSRRIRVVNGSVAKLNFVGRGSPR